MKKISEQIDETKLKMVEEENNTQQLLKYLSSFLEVDYHSMDKSIIFAQHTQLIYSWLPQQYQQCKNRLLYKGSLHGFKAQNFHERCDSQGPTLSLISSENGREFGGFASISWSTTGNHVPDPHAFIFSLSSKTKHEQYQNQGRALSFNGQYLCNFGGNHDLRIYDLCNNNTNSYSNLGHVFTC